MLSILTQTKLAEKAFWPTPINKDLLANSDTFWQKTYRAQGCYQYHSELDYLFHLLFKAIKQLAFTQDSFASIVDTLESFQKKCYTPPFTNYIMEIKKQLELITYFFYCTPPAKKKSCLALQLLDIDVCAEGSFLKLQQIAYTLSETDNIFSWLAMFRLEIIYRFLSTLTIRSVHDFSAILNYAQSLGLNVIEENRITQTTIASDQHQRPLSECEKAAFNTFFCRHYCVSRITDYISQRLEKKLKACLQEFQQEISGLGWGISTQIPTSILEKKLSGLPMQELHRFLKPISEEDDSYYQIKSIAELRKEIACYLTESKIFKKKSKKIKLGKTTWKFTLIEGDNLAEYGYISYKENAYIETQISISAFEEKGLYQYISLKKFDRYKQFLMLGELSFKHFYSLGVNFSNSYLVDIDFKPLGQGFLALNGLEQAHLICPQLTYEQFLSFYQLNRDKSLQSNCIITFTHAKQFFMIIENNLDPEFETLELFIARHKKILASEPLYDEVLMYLNEKKIALETQLTQNFKKINDIDFMMKFISTKSIVFYITITFTLLTCGTLVPFLLYAGCILLILSALFMEISSVSIGPMKCKQANYIEQITELRKEINQTLNLKNIFMQTKNEKIITKAKKFNLDSYIITSNTACNKKNNLNPTSISDYLLSGIVELPKKTTPLDNIANYRAPHYNKII
jgi:hypothetical protein